MWISPEWKMTASHAPQVPRMSYEKQITWICKGPFHLATYDGVILDQFLSWSDNGTSPNKWFSNCCFLKLLYIFKQNLYRTLLHKIDKRPLHTPIPGSPKGTLWTMALWDKVENL